MHPSDRIELAEAPEGDPLISRQHASSTVREGRSLLHAAALSCLPSHMGANMGEVNSAKTMRTWDRKKKKVLSISSHRSWTSSLFSRTSSAGRLWSKDVRHEFRLKVGGSTSNPLAQVEHRCQHLDHSMSVKQWTVPHSEAYGLLYTEERHKSSSAVGTSSLPCVLSLSILYLVRATLRSLIIKAPKSEEDFVWFVIDPDLKPECRALKTKCMHYSDLSLFFAYQFSKRISLREHMLLKYVPS